MLVKHKHQNRFVIAKCLLINTKHQRMAELLLITVTIMILYRHYKGWSKNGFGFDFIRRTHGSVCVCCLCVCVRDRLTRAFSSSAFSSFSRCSTLATQSPISDRLVRMSIKLSRDTLTWRSTEEKTKTMVMSATYVRFFSSTDHIQR